MNGAPKIEFTETQKDTNIKESTRRKQANIEVIIINKPGPGRTG